MRILFDQGTPAPLRHALQGHTVATAHERGWSALINGELIAAAEREFDVLVTTDQNLRYQQNLSERRLAVVVLPTTSWPRLKLHAQAIASQIGAVKAGDYVEIVLPA